MSVNSDWVCDDRLTLSETSTLNALLTNLAQRQDYTCLLQATPRDLIYMRYTNFNQQALHPIFLSRFPDLVNVDAPST